MNYERLKESFLQGEEREAAQMFREMMRGAVRAGLLEAMKEEVEAICGPRYRPDPEARLRRAGSEKGIAYVDGGKEKIIRPRVREKGGKEVRLATYEAASSPQGLFDQIVAAVGQGLPVRGCARAMNKALSKSEISRMWVEKSREQLEALRSRPLGSIEWMALVIDGVWLTRELCVVVAIGIESDGNKWVLDFEEGPSENGAVVLSLLERIKSRGFAPVAGRRLLILRDGSEAIESAVKRHWPESVRQECMVHAHSNLREKVRLRDRAEVDGLFKTLREAQGKEAGEEAFDDLLEFVSERNAAAALSLGKRRDVLLAFHRLNVPSTLNVTFLSTNLIENALRNWRAASGNVKRWNEKKDMVSRWMAAGLLWAEAGFQKIRHAEDLPALARALELSAPASAATAASPSAPSTNAINRGLAQSV